MLNEDIRPPVRQLYYANSPALPEVWVHVCLVLYCPSAGLLRMMRPFEFKVQCVKVLVQAITMQLQLKLCDVCTKLFPLYDEI